MGKLSWVIQDPATAAGSGTHWAPLCVLKRNAVLFHRFVRPVTLELIAFLSLLFLIKNPKQT